MNADGQALADECIVYSRLLESMAMNSSCHPVGYIHLKNGELHGVIEMGDNYLFQCSEKRSDGGEIDHYELIIADNSEEKKRMAVLTAESVGSELVEMDSSGMKENVIIDLNREGRRWEGGELNGKPFGFGREYSEDDNLVYEGFVFEGKKVCVGKDFLNHSIHNNVMYEGGYCNGERWGKGISYDLNGHVDFEGEWMNNHGIVVKEGEHLIVPMSIEKVVFLEKKYNHETITALYFSQLFLLLRRIVISKQCFEKVDQFILDGLPNFETMIIGKGCFGNDNERENGIFQISNCPTLRRVEIGESSFGSFKFVQFIHLHAIQSIEIGDDCFSTTHSFRMDDLPNLSDLIIGQHCFTTEKEDENDRLCRIVNCPALRQLTIGDNDFEHFTSLELVSVNSLQSIDFGPNCFKSANFSLTGRKSYRENIMRKMMTMC